VLLLCLLAVCFSENVYLTLNGREYKAAATAHNSKTDRVSFLIFLVQKGCVLALINIIGYYVYIYIYMAWPHGYGVSIYI
jgi:hypothetical protein